MDAIKMQIEILKIYGKSDYDIANLKLAKGECEYFISIKPSWFTIIHESKFLLKLPENTSAKTFKQLIENGKNERVQVVVTSELFKDKEGTFVKLIGENFHVWVNQQKLKRFGKPENLKFMCSKHTAPVFIYENDVLLGCVAPRNLK